jgi:hypothetical protein
MTNCRHHLALTGVFVLGIATIIGSGGGGETESSPCFLVPCTIGGGGGTPLPPALTASVVPAYVTLQAGTQVTYTVQVQNATTELGYQWSRSFDGGNTFVDIAGATGSTYAINGVTLADDGAVFAVKVQPSSGFTTWSTRGRLFVSPLPGVVFEDADFDLKDWAIALIARAGIPSSFPHTEETATAGGNPGAFLKSTVQLPAATGVVGVRYARLGFSYDPATQGAINVVDFAADCILLPSAESTFFDTQLLLEQGGRRYSGYRAGGALTCSTSAWVAIPMMSSLARTDFTLVEGSSCNTDESCPDFSAGGKPLSFGFERYSLGTPGDVVSHGIDNWRVTVWRK